MSHKPERSGATKFNGGSFRGFTKTPGGFTGATKGGRVFNGNADRPAAKTSPKGPKQK